MHAAVLRYLDAVAREGSIRRASERLNISASAVNRQILNLERHFATPLFERHPAGLRLTEAGRLVLAHARRTLDDFDRLAGDVGALRGIVGGEVTLMALDSLNVHFLPEALTRFVAIHPAVRVRTLAGDPIEIMHAVAQGSADLGFSFHPGARGGLRVLHDIPCGLHAIMRSDHPLAGRATLTLRDCADHPLIYQQSSGSMQTFFGAEMEEFRRAHPPVQICDTLALIKRLILRDVGIAFYTPLGFVEEVAEGRLVAIPLAGDTLSSLRLALIAPKERAQTVAQGAMAAHMATALADYGDFLRGGM